MNELSFLLLAICVMVGVILLAGGLYQIEYRKNKKEWDKNGAFDKPCGFEVNRKL